MRTSGRPRIALVYPSTYQASITNLFTHIAYYFLVEKSDALVDRFTLDNPSEGAITSRKLHEFDLLLVSANYELDLLYLSKLLDRSGIELSSSKRRKKPIILVGGLAAMANPEPFLEVADACYVGDGEILLEKLARSLSLLPDKPADFLESLGEGLYTGEATTEKVYVEDLNDAPHPTAEIRSKNVEPVYGEGFYIEISRGCRWLCKFCLEAYTMYPFRYRSLETIKSLVGEGLKYVRRRRVVVYSLSPFDHPRFRDFLSYMVENGIDFSIPSIRWDTLRLDDLDLISLSSQRTLTLAPESMNRDLSCSIGKCFNFDTFSELAISALKKGFNIKLYIMVGLPLEREEHVLETIKHVKYLVSYSRKLRKNITININPLVPKPHTPLQDHPLITEEEYLRKVEFFRKEIGENRVTSLRWLYAFLQSLIALGNREIGKLAVSLALRGLSRRNIVELSNTLGVNTEYPLRWRSPSERPWHKVVFPLDHVVNKLSL
ncbi:MAG: radical SAM protein [Sulfolobales archaeon]